MEDTAEETKQSKREKREASDLRFISENSSSSATPPSLALTNLSHASLLSSQEEKERQYSPQAGRVNEGRQKATVESGRGEERRYRLFCFEDG
jgi:hypothetical protein